MEENEAPSCHRACHQSHAGAAPPWTTGVSIQTSTTWSAGCVVAHLVGGAGLLYANKGRVAAQSGVGASPAAKLALTVAALGVTPYSRALGKKLEKSAGTPGEGGTDPAAGTPEDVAKAQQQLKIT